MTKYHGKHWSYKQLNVTSISVRVIEHGNLSGLPIVHFELGESNKSLSETINLWLIDWPDNLPRTIFIDASGADLQSLCEDVKAIRKFETDNNLRMTPLVIKHTSPKLPAVAALASWMISGIDISDYVGAPTAELHVPYRPDMPVDPYTRMAQDATTLFLIVDDKENIGPALAWMQSTTNPWRVCFPSVWKPIKTIWSKPDEQTDSIEVDNNPL
jgi:hypothetical protein